MRTLKFKKLKNNERQSFFTSIHILSQTYLTTLEHSSKLLLLLSIWQMRIQRLLQEIYGETIITHQTLTLFEFSNTQGFWNYKNYLRTIADLQFISKLAGVDLTMPVISEMELEVARTNRLRDTHLNLKQPSNCRILAMKRIWKS